MSKVSIIAITSPARWSEACAGFADHNLYQTWGFGEVSAADTNSDPCRLLLQDDRGVIGAAQLRIRKIPFLRAGLAYLYCGPIWRRPGSEPNTFAMIVAALREEFTRNRGLELRLMPTVNESAECAFVQEAMVNSGCLMRKGEKAHRTMVVDLRPALDDLRKGLAQKWRNGLNQAERREIRIETRTDDEAMVLFEAMYDSMWMRKQFETGVTVSSFRRLQQLLSPQERLNIQIAYDGTAPIAGHVSSTLGDTCLYLLGASNEKGREWKASYVLQWRAMMNARELGATRYDLGGIDHQANPGVLHFKAGLGGVELEFPGTFEAHSAGASRIVVPFAERVHRFVRGFFKKGKSAGQRDLTGTTPPPGTSDTSCPSMANLSS